MWQRRTCHWQGRNPHLRVQFDRDKDPLEEGVQQLQDAYQGDEGLQQPSSLSPLRDTQDCASFHCGILALEPVDRRRMAQVCDDRALGPHCPSGWCKKSMFSHPTEHGDAWGWLQPSDKSHNHPHSHPVAIRRAPCCAAGKPPGQRREYSAGVVWDIGYGWPTAST